MRLKYRIGFGYRLGIRHIIPSFTTFSVTVHDFIEVIHFQTLDYSFSVKVYGL